MEQLENGKEKSQTIFFVHLWRNYSCTDVASIKESSKSHQSEHLRRRCVQGQSWKRFEARLVENQRPESWNYFSQAVCIILRKNTCGQLICGLEKDNSQCSMFKLPPYWAAHEPVDMVVWCWMENKNPPQQTERAGTEEERVEREEPSTDGLCCD